MPGQAELERSYRDCARIAAALPTAAADLDAVLEDFQLRWISRIGDVLGKLALVVDAGEPVEIHRGG